MRLGAHVSVAGGIENAIERQRDIGGNCGQIFVGSPRGWKVAEYTQDEAEKFHGLKEDEDQKPYLVHSTYLVNLGTPKDDLFKKSLNCLQAELDAASMLGIEYVVFHPGAHTGSGVENGINRIAEGVDELEIPGDVKLLFENTAGKGTTLGRDFSDLREMMDRTSKGSDDVGVCIDSCHAHAAGYDLADSDGFREMVEELDTEVGLENVEALHLNDSKDPCGSEKDNHMHIGEGEIGDDGFRNIVNHPELGSKPMVLETPERDGKGYKENLGHIQGLIDN